MLLTLDLARDRVRERDQRGFTMIELLVVVLILAVLIAIAIPTFLGARRPASDRQAQSLTRTGMLAARSVMSDRDTYDGLVAGDLAAEENTTAFVDAATPANATRSEVSVGAGTQGSESYVILASGSTSGTCFALLDWGDRSPSYQAVDSSDCAADDFAPGTGWDVAWP